MKPFCEAVMWQAGNLPGSWLEVAAEAKKETDPKKLIEIIARLCRALEQIRVERGGKLPRKSAAA